MASKTCIRWAKLFAIAFGIVFLTLYALNAYSLSSSNYILDHNSQIGGNNGEKMSNANYSLIVEDSIQGLYSSSANYGFYLGHIYIWQDLSPPIVLSFFPMNLESEAVDQAEHSIQALDDDELYYCDINYYNTSDVKIGEKTVYFDGSDKCISFKSLQNGECIRASADVFDKSLNSSRVLFGEYCRNDIGGALIGIIPITGFGIFWDNMLFSLGWLFDLLKWLWNLIEYVLGYGLVCFGQDKDCLLTLLSDAGYFFDINVLLLLIILLTILLALKKLKGKKYIVLLTILILVEVLVWAKKIGLY